MGAFDGQNVIIDIIGTTYNNPNDHYDYGIYTKVKDGARKLDNIVLRRITQKEISPGHYWIEIIHQDEDEVDEFMKKARKKPTGEWYLHNLNEICKKANGFRESYGWYPDDASFNIKPKPLKLLKGNGFLNGDCELRRNKDMFRSLSNKVNREAGRREENNNLSIRPFDPHQNGRFHPKDIDFTTNPYLLPGDSRTDEQIIAEIRDFAKSFKDEWSWHFDTYNETNCHTFLFLLLATCNLADPDCIGKGLDQHFLLYKQSLDFLKSKKADPKYVKRKNLINKLDKISQPSNTIG